MQNYEYGTNTGCGNCSHDCCCNCRNIEHCYLCRPRGEYIPFKLKSGGTTCGEPTYTGRNVYPSHFICWDCHIQWKGSFVDRRSKETIKNDKQIWHGRGKEGEKDSISTTRCPQCSEEGEKVPLSVRAPKQNDKKGWELFEKLYIGEGLERRHGYLSSKWNFGNMIHVHPSVYRILNIPKKLYEYDDWVKYMNKTKIPKEANYYPPVSNNEKKKKQKKEIKEKNDEIKELIKKGKITKNMSIKDIIEYQDKAYYEMCYPTKK